MATSGGGGVRDSLTLKQVFMAASRHSLKNGRMLKSKQASKHITHLHFELEKTLAGKKGRKRK